VHMSGKIAVTTLFGMVNQEWPVDWSRRTVTNEQTGTPATWMDNLVISSDTNMSFSRECIFGKIDATLGLSFGKTSGRGGPREPSEHIPVPEK
jgi:hypothetical protein